MSTLHHCCKRFLVFVFAQILCAVLIEVSKNIMNLVDAPVEDLSDVLCKVCQLQEVCELNFDDEGLQQEHDALDVEHVLVAGHSA
jgi:hypothetical protein